MAGPACLSELCATKLTAHPARCWPRAQMPLLPHREWSKATQKLVSLRPDITECLAVTKASCLGKGRAV